MRRLVALALFAFTLQLQAVSGRVTDNNGAAVEGARVTAYRAELPEQAIPRAFAGTPRPALASATTDSEGRFAIDVKGVVELDVEREGFAPAFPLVAGDEADVVISISKAPLVTLNVVSRGAPVEHALVVVTSLFRVHVLGWTDASGHVRVPQLSDWLDDLIVVHPDYEPHADRDRAETIDLVRGTSVMGKVVDEHGVPVAGAFVRCGDALFTSSRDDGSFIFPHADSTEALIACKDHACGSVAAVPNAAVHLREGSAARGVVRDEAGHAIEGVPVFVVGDRYVPGAVTDARGEFQLPRIEARGLLRVIAGDDVIAKDRKAAAGAGNDLVLMRPPVIAGVVVLESNAPVAGAHVGFVAPEGFETIKTVTDRAGRFRRRVPAGLHGRIQAIKPSLPRVLLGELVVPSSGIHDLVVKIPKGVLVSGTVVDSNGRPVEGAGITYSDQDSESFVDETRSRADGTFSFRMNSGVRTLAFKKTGFVAQLVEVEAAGSQVAVRVVMPERILVRGVVVRSDGAPISQVRVSSGYGVPSTTDNAGRFEVECKPGKNQLTVHTKTFDVVAPSANERIVMGEGSIVRGRVIDAGTGQPLEEYSVEALQTQALDESAIEYHHGGEFVVRGIDRSQMTIGVSAEGYLGKTLQGDGSEGVLTFALGRGISIRGRVRDAIGKPIEGVDIFASTVGKSTSARAVTGEDGAFELKGLDSGDAVDLMFTKSGFLVHMRKVQTPVAELLEIQMSGTVSIRGRVLNANGEGAEKVMITAATSVRTESPSETPQATTDESGAFEMIGLAAARYDFEAWLDMHRAGAARDVDVEHVHDIVIRLQPMGTISGRVSGATGETITVFAEQAEDHAQVNVAPDGTYRFANVPPGVVKLRAALYRQQRARATRPIYVEVSAGMESRGDLVFEPRHTLRGRVICEGQPFSGTVMFSSGDVPFVEAMTAPDGSYSIELEADRYGFNVSSPCGSAVGTVEVEHESSLDIALTPQRSLRVHVVDDATNEPLSTASVEADFQSSLTGADGIAIVHPSAENTRLVVSRKGYGTTAVNASGPDVIARLPRAGSIAARIVDARDGRSLWGCVVARDLAGNMLKQECSVDSDDGSVGLPLTPGEYFVTAYTRGYGAVTMRLRAPAKDLQIGLVRGGALMITSQTPLNQPATLTLPNGDPYFIALQNLVLTGRTTLLDDLAPGSYSLHVGTRQYAVTVRENETVSLPID